MSRLFLCSLDYTACSAVRGIQKFRTLSVTIIGVARNFCRVYQLAGGSGGAVNSPPVEYSGFAPGS